MFQVDLFSARGMMPRTLSEAAQREKDIRFSSRTRLNTDVHTRLADLESAVARLVKKLPENLRDDPDCRALVARSGGGPVTIMHLINRPEDYESEGKDYEFSHTTLTGHWAAGVADVTRSLASPRWRKRHPPARGIVTLDLE